MVGTATWKTVWQFLKKLNIELLDDSIANLLLGINTRELKTHVHKKLVQECT